MSFLFGSKKDSKVDYEPVQIRDDKKKLKRARSALFMTQGGAMGQELQSGDVTPRDTIFGN